LITPQTLLPPAADAGPKTGAVGAAAPAPDGPAPAYHPPAWDTVTHSVLCPLCDYDLRGLTEPRCPECGYAFTWPELFDPALKAHPYLFEHNPRRPVRSFLRTMAGGLRPRRFWRSLRPTQPSRPRRLVLYWCLASVLALAGFVTHALADFIPRARENEVDRRAELASLIKNMNRPGVLPAWYVKGVAARGGPRAMIDAVSPPWSNRNFLARWWQVYRSGPTSNVLPVVVLYVAWPWVTFVTLLVFNQSMRRAGVKRIHVLRCVLYCCDAGVWLVPSVVVLVAVLGGRHADGDPLQTLFAALALFAGVTTWRLAAAYRLYLRFDRPLATALAAQLIVVLFLLGIVLNIPRV
jgi:hypothetical protein